MAFFLFYSIAMNDGKATETGLRTCIFVWLITCVNSKIGVHSTPCFSVYLFGGVLCLTAWLLKQLLQLVCCFYMQLISWTITIPRVLEKSSFSRLSNFKV